MLTRRELCTAAAMMPLLGLVPGRVPAAGNEIQLMSAGLFRFRNENLDGLYLTAAWEFDLPDALLESLRRGIALYFAYEFRLVRSRWYWFDREVAGLQQVQRLSYTPLSRQYRISFDGLTLSFDSIDLALPLVKAVRDWRVGDADLIGDISKYEAETRMSLDTSRLPKPLQVTIGGNSDWALDSGWQPVRLTEQLAER